MKSRVATDSLHRLCRALLLPLLLLCVQQGAFLHELSHYKPAQSQDEDHKQNSGGPCALCLAYAGVESAVSQASPPPLLLTGLSFALMPVMATFARAASVPAQRNRGPPDLR
jgi:hypothetical protein